MITKFDPTSDNVTLYIKIMKEQGMETCQNMINKDYIKQSTETMSFGFLSLTERAAISRQKGSSNRYTLNGFALCRLSNPKIAWVDLVCSRPAHKIGKELMQAVEDHCRELKTVVIVHLFSIDDHKLVKWYQSLGYITEKINVWDCKTKGHLMTKFL